MRFQGALLLGCSLAWAGRAHFNNLSFDLPASWEARPVARPPTDAAPVDDSIFDLLPPRSSKLRATLTVYAGKVSEAELEQQAAERHSARVKNRVAWGMKADAGPPREIIKLGTRRAVRWHDRVGGALGQNEQLMSCAIVGARLSCVLSTGPNESRDEAEELAYQILSSLKR